uniref:PTB domain-containing protein n=1 Tax=Angiostrongylus cantonensis TaxID=6313 RepID=A0A0K0DKA9_ANGCA
MRCLSATASDGTELVRHFLIEPSPKGVKLKGCNNEEPKRNERKTGRRGFEVMKPFQPVFGSLSALVYQHSITPLALPTKLLLPEYDPATTPEHISATQALLEQGAACNVAYIGSMDCESLTGSECVRRAVARTVEDTQRGITRPVSVHFKVSSQGVTLTDNTRKVFFRRHFPVNSVIFAGMDPSDRKFDNNIVIGFHEACMRSARIFAIVARKVGLHL